MDDLPADELGLDPTERLRGLAARAFFGGAALPEARSVPGARIYAVRGPFEVGEPAVLAIGTFDGVHRGHQRLIGLAADDARHRGVPVVVVTFDPDPSQVLGAAGPGSLLLDSPDRLRALCSFGVDAVVAFDFDEAFAALGYEEFATDWLCRLLQPIAIHVGRDFALGRAREGTLGTLEVLFGALGIPLYGHELLSERGAPISATRIRALLQAGEVERAAELLGRPAFVSGVVAHGRGEGASLGFPTANVRFDPTFAFPARGVYAGLCRRGDRVWPAAVNLGSPPSFREAPAPGDADPDQPAVALAEAMLLGFEGDLYGRDVQVALVERLRPSVRFDTVEELQAAVRGNLEETRVLLGSRPVGVG